MATAFIRVSPAFFHFSFSIQNAPQNVAHLIPRAVLLTCRQEGRPPKPLLAMVLGGRNNPFVRRRIDAV
jgi:hypothetical protein